MAHTQNLRLTLVIGMAGYLFLKATTAVDDPSQYPTIVEFFAESRRPQLVAHFPENIPEHAEDVKFYYRPGFMQGANILQLQMRLPPDEVEQIQEQAKAQAVRLYGPDSDNNSPLSEKTPDGCCKVTFDYSLYTGEPDEGMAVSREPFPENYTVYVFHDSRGAPKYDWNHPELYGIAVNDVFSEVVYWMEDR